MAIKLAFTPQEGSTSNYMDCAATAPDGSVWMSLDNKWYLKAPAVPKLKRHFDSWEEARKRTSPLYGAFGFFVAMALFARPVGMSFPSFAVGGPILLAIGCVCGFLFYRLFR